MEKKAVPMRTCIVCKACKPKRDLARIVKNADGLNYDASGKLNGRGAYVCKSEECIKKLAKGKFLNRAFKMEVTDEEYAKIEEQFFGEQN